MKDWPKVPEITRLRFAQPHNATDYLILSCRYADGMCGWVKWRLDTGDPKNTTAEKYWMHFMARMEIAVASLEHFWLRDIAKVPEFQR